MSVIKNDFTGGLSFGDWIKKKSKELSRNIDLSGAKLPAITTANEVEIGGTTKTLLTGFLILAALYVVSLLFKR